MKKLSIGVQYLENLINGGYIYVDKTEHIHRLITEGEAYFLSRPRRFGKSLLISTLDEIFKGNRELFKGLWIYDKIEWKAYPVIRLDFSKLDYKYQSLETALDNELVDLARKAGIICEKPTFKDKFVELIEKLSVGKKIVILIDEYDKPIIDYIDNIEQADKNREILKSFYSGLKSLSDRIHFLLITGVSKFSRVSIFSDLNHLRDITLDEAYAVMLGYTETEIKRHFSDYLKAFGRKVKLNRKDLLARIRHQYNGYSWDGKNFVYNPFSLLNALAAQDFGNYWFATGTPTMLVNVLRDKPIDIEGLEGMEVRGAFFDKFTLQNFDIFSLLFQTGYLTVKAYDPLRGVYRLNYPNNEVRISFLYNLLEGFCHQPQSAVNSATLKLEHALSAKGTGFGLATPTAESPAPTAQSTASYPANPG